jgi:RNA polymerase sigma factor (TIGR02999 family)
VLSSDQITEVLRRWSKGDDQALNELVPLVYERLRQMALYQLQNERTGHTLQPTALVHEAYLKLAKQPKIEWNNRLHFLAVAARAMRQILIDYARKRNRLKGPGKYAMLPLDEAFIFAPDKSSALLSLDEALKKLGQEEPRLGQVVELRIFGGLDNHEIASILDISETTVTRDWNMAIARLGGLIRNGSSHDPGTS